MNSFIILVCLCVGSVSYSSASSAADAQQDAGNIILHWFRCLKDKFAEGWNNIRPKFVEVWNNIKHKSVELWTGIKTEVMNACSCINFDCGCCSHLEVKEINLNNTICVNGTYLVHDYGISFTVTVDKHTILNATVSVRNPPPVCPDFGVLEIKELVDACIRLYDIDASTTHLHACVRLEVHSLKIMQLGKLEIGCLNFGHPKSSIDKTSLETHEASHTTVIAVAVTTGIILVTVAVVIALARKRGMFQHPASRNEMSGVVPICRDLLLNRQKKYGSLVSA